MNSHLLNQCTADAFAGTTTFGETIERMFKDGVEWYSANLILGIKTHYAADLAHHSVCWPDYARPAVADSFSVEQVVAAIRESQKRAIDYPEFLSRIATAGVVSYTVHLKGRKAIYFGRHGEFYIEPFPTM